MNIKKIIASTGAAAAMFGFAAVAAFAITAWNQGFETDTSGWLDSSNTWYGTVNRVPSGTDGITSADGNFHAIFEGDATSAPFSRFDEYRDTWTGSWTAEIDVYLDPSWTTGTGFDYSVAASGSDGNHQRDFIFHVTKDTSTSNLLVAGSNNTNFAPREDLDTLGNHYVVPSAGWYTLQHVFRDQGGALAVDLNLLDSGGNVVFTETRYNATDTIPAEVGGNRYSWFTYINVPGGITVDNHELIVTDIDTEAPVVDITSHADGDVVNGSVEVRGSVTDENPDHYYAVLRDSSNNVVAGPGTVYRYDSFTDEMLFTFDSSALTEDATYTIWLAARDAAGNRDDSVSLDTAEITVNNTPDNKNQCKNGGWESFTNPTFKNQGQCVSYIQSNDNAGKRN